MAVTTCMTWVVTLTLACVHRASLSFSTPISKSLSTSPSPLAAALDTHTFESANHKSQASPFIPFNHATVHSLRAPSRILFQRWDSHVLGSNHLILIQSDSLSTDCCNTHRFQRKPVECSTGYILVFLCYVLQYWTPYFHCPNKKAKQTLSSQPLKEVVTRTPLSFMVSPDVNLTTF